MVPNIKVSNICHVGVCYTLGFVIRVCLALVSFSPLAFHQNPITITTHTEGIKYYVIVLLLGHWPISQTSVN